MTRSFDIYNLVKESDGRVIREQLDAWTDAGWHVNSCIKEGMPYLSVAIINRSLPVVNEFLLRGADPNMSQDTITPLMVAAIAGVADVIEPLVSRGADLEALNTRGDTALLVAAINLKVDVVRHLVRLGANRSHRNYGGESAADIARRCVEVRQGSVPPISAEYWYVGYYETLALLEQTF